MEHPFIKVRDWKGLLSGGVGGAPADATHGQSATEHDVFHLVLSHQPDNAPPLARAGADLILCGHTHGGQWRFPIIGPMVYPSVYGRRFAPGLSELDGALLHIGNGVGVHTVPFRWLCPPDIVLLVLRRRA